MESKVRGLATFAFKKEGWEVIPLDCGRGYPDQLIIPNKKEDTFFVEYKSLKTKGKLMNNQKLTIKKLRGYGFHVFEVDENTVLSYIIDLVKHRR